jgi:hypothetical protein
MMKVAYKKFLTLLLVLLVAVFFAYGCEPGDSDPSTTGPCSKCTYTLGLSDLGYSSAIVYYPCETEGAPFAATTLTGGYTNTKEDMEWLSEHLVSHGFIVIAMTPNNIMGFNDTWQRAHNAGIAKLKSENTRSSSPISGLVRTGDLQIMGFSKGGGGALLAAADQGTGIKTCQGLAPYMDFGYDLSGISAQTIVHTGSSDMIAPANSQGKPMFNDLPSTIDRTYAEYRSASHTDWYGLTGSYRDRFKTYVTSWMKVYLDGDENYRSFIDGSQDWFADFIHNPAGSSSGGCE